MPTGDPDGPPIPRYGTRALSDLVPSLLAGLGVAGEQDALALGTMRRAVLLLIDGLGDDALADHADAAPFLSSHRREPLTAGFPSTTAASVSSLGTGLAPGEHGLVGYTIAVPGHPHRPMNVLVWSLYGHGPDVDLRGELPPERFQPLPTALERARASGLPVSLVGPRHHAGSGMTRAVLRGGRYRPAYGLGDLVGETLAAVRAEARTLVYAYHADLDLVGHVRGTATEAWRLHLEVVDRAAETLAGLLPEDTDLVITGDHGMVDVAPGDAVDLADLPALSAGLRVLAGEPRARHAHAIAGAEHDLLEVWRETLGDRFWVVSREQAVASGWFGPVVPARVLGSIGDVVAASRGQALLTQRSVDPLQAGLLGHHGSMTRHEQLVPLILARSEPPM